MAEASRCLSCPPEQTQAPLEACFALPTLELRPDCSRRSETNKHDVTLLWRPPPPLQTTMPSPKEIWPDRADGVTPYKICWD